jgi:hypothetical protein
MAERTRRRRCTEDTHFWPMHDAGRTPTPGESCNCGARQWQVPRFTDDDFAFTGAVAADMLRRLWNHNPDLVLDAFTPFVLGETDDGDLAVWRGHPNETTPALEVFGDDDDDKFESAVVWIVQHRNDSVPALAMLPPSSTENSNG